jgi:hypothetical protein
MYHWNVIEISFAKLPSPSGWRFGENEGTGIRQHST